MYLGMCICVYAYLFLVGSDGELYIGLRTRVEGLAVRAGLL